VGVSHFLSKNLVHHYDHRQAGYGYLLQHALARHPGTAVLEIEEARAIAQRVVARRGGSNGLAPPPRGAGSCRWRIHCLSESRPPPRSAVDLTVFVRRGDGVEEIRKTGLAPADVVALLTGELARRILELGDEPSALFSPAEQRDWLIARAEQFGRVGAWDHSIGLREAALLIDPDDVPLRLALLSEYTLQMSRRLPVPVKPEQVPTEEELREACRARVAAFFARLEHLEFLVRNRKVRADELLASQLPNGSLFSVSERLPVTRPSIGFPRRASIGPCPPRSFLTFMLPRMRSEAQQFIRTTAREEYAVADERHAAFMESVFPRIASLRRYGYHEGHVAKQWVAYLLAYHKPWTMARPALSAEEVDAVYRTIVEALGQGTGLGRDVQMQWAEYLLEHHERRAGVGALSAEMLDDVFHVITEVFPRSSFLHKALMEQLARFVQRDMRSLERTPQTGNAWLVRRVSGSALSGLPGPVGRERPTGRPGLRPLRPTVSPLAPLGESPEYPELRRRAREPETFATASELSDQDEQAALQAELSSLAEEAKQWWPSACRAASRFKVPRRHASGP
jgi:hypothetical protein